MRVRVRVRVRVKVRVRVRVRARARERGHDRDESLITGPRLKSPLPARVRPEPAGAELGLYVVAPRSAPLLESRWR